MPLDNKSTTLYNGADVETGTAAVPLRVDPTGTTPQPVTGTVTANQGAAAAVGSAWPILVTDGVNTAAIATATPAGGAAGLVVRVAGSVTFSQALPATSTVTRVTVANVNTNLLALNANRLGAMFWNDDASNPAYIKLGTTASLTSFSARLSPKSLYEIQTPAYTGNVDAITSASTAAVLVTELTP